MLPFMESEHDRSMRQYEQLLCEAKASDSSARSDFRRSIEDDLVDGGLAAIEKYVADLDERWKRACSLAQYDGLGMGYGIAQRAKDRLLAENNQAN